MNFKNLSSIGFPNYNLFENGDIINIKTSNILKYFGSKARVSLYHKGKKIFITKERLMNEFFPKDFNTSTRAREFLSDFWNELRSWF